MSIDQRTIDASSSMPSIIQGDVAAAAGCRRADLPAPARDVTGGQSADGKLGRRLRRRPPVDY